MSKVPVIKPFNIAEYASRNKFNVSQFNPFLLSKLT